MFLKILISETQGGVSLYHKWAVFTEFKDITEGWPLSKEAGFEY